MSEFSINFVNMEKDANLEKLREFYLHKIKSSPEHLMSHMVEVKRSKDVMQMQAAYDGHVLWLIEEGYELVNGQEEE